MQHDIGTGALWGFNGHNLVINSNIPLLREVDFAADWSGLFAVVAKDPLKEGNIIRPEIIEWLFIHTQVYSKDCFRFQRSLRAASLKQKDVPLPVFHH